MKTSEIRIGKPWITVIKVKANLAISKVLNSKQEDMESEAVLIYTLSVVSTSVKGLSVIRNYWLSLSLKLKSKWIFSIYWRTKNLLGRHSASCLVQRRLKLSST